MAYLARPDAVNRRADPRNILPETRSVLVVAASYAGASHSKLPSLHGRVSRYAWGADYHRWLLHDLETLVQRLAATHGPFPYRCYVDTGPILERAWAQAAGLGWLGKNTNLIHPRLGSYLFLGIALLGLELESVPPPDLPTCGDCTRCIDACPTGALVAPGVLDARRCIAVSRSNTVARFRKICVHCSATASSAAIRARRYVRGTTNRSPPTSTPPRHKRQRSICRDC